MRLLTRFKVIFKYFTSSKATECHFCVNRMQKKLRILTRMLNKLSERVSSPPYTFGQTADHVTRAQSRCNTQVSRWRSIMSHIYSCSVQNVIYYYYYYLIYYIFICCFFFFILLFAQADTFENVYFREKHLNRCALKYKIQ